MDLLLGDEDLLQVGAHVGSVHGSSPRRCRRWCRRVGGVDGRLSTRRRPTDTRHRLGRQQGPGRSTGPWPCQSVSSASQRLECARVLTCPAGAPAAMASRRQTRVRTARGSAVERRRDRPRRRRRPGPRAAVASAQRVEVVGVLAQLVGACGPAPRRRPARGRARGRQRPRAGPDPGEGRVRVLRVVPEVEARARAQAARSGRRRHREEGTAVAAAGRARIPARDRGPGAPGEAEQHLSRPGRRGCGRAGRPRRRGARRRRVESARSGRRGRRPRGRPRRRRPSTRTTSTGSRPERVAPSGRRVGDARPSPSCSPWSTTTAPARTPALGAPRRRRRRRAPGSRRPRCRRRAPGRPGRTRPAPRAPRAGPRRRRPVTGSRPASGQPWTRATQADGVVDLGRQSAGSRATPRRG